MFLLGCTFFSWKQAYGFSPLFAKLFLLSPVTYTHEGMRAAMLGQNNYLPLWLCVTVILCWSAVLIFLLQRAIKQRLDPI
jgi:ABC-type polysaccharide/polyol phosphate export permease